MPAAPTVWTDAVALTVAALFAARARRDALTDGTAIVSEYFDDVRLRRPAGLTSGARSQLYAGVGEYCNAIGWPQAGARFGAEALLFADTDALRYRALSVTALGHALNGEYLSAQTASTTANELFQAQGWPVSETAYLVLLADALIAAARLDPGRLRATADRMRQAQPDDAYSGYTARAIEVMALMFSHDFGGARASGRQLLHGSRRLFSHRMIRYFLVSMLSDVLVAQGEYQEALITLEAYESPEGHGICFSMQRSAAHLWLGHDRELLAETDVCVAAETDHCLRTLTPLLIRRALALHRVGNARRAHQSMESALLIIARTGLSATPFLMLPHDETRALVDAVVSNRPELADAAPHLRDTLAHVAIPDRCTVALPHGSQLTPTERALTSLLMTPLTLSEIAGERGVSLNTVKSQVRSIYSKLGVRGRSEMIELLTTVDV